MAEGMGKLLVVACEPLDRITTVDSSVYPHASNALAYFLGSGQAICPDGKVFGGNEDVVTAVLVLVLASKGVAQGHRPDRYSYTYSSW
eukprot:SAG25_NODE_223_length_11586_cov_9.792635_7_plen_88_part_00